MAASVTLTADLDPSGSMLGTLWDPDSQDAILEVGIDVARLELVAQDETASI
jgi:hypothetical protein